jgi:hemolysin III
MHSLKNTQINKYPPSEERLNIRSHAAGLLLSIPALILLMNKAIDQQQSLYIFAYLIYGLGQMTVFAASTFYHASRNENARRRLKIFDHSAIYLSIAGTYTPVTLLVLQGIWGWTVFAVVWILALMGIVLKLFFTGRFRTISTIGYVGMGLVIIIAIQPLIESMSLWGLIWLAAGGVFYIAGAVLYRLEKLSYNHATFHFFVLIAAICHFLKVYFHT